MTCIDVHARPLHGSANPHFRIQAHVEQIHDQVGAQDSHGDQQEQSLHERIVVGAYRAHQLKAQARIRKDNLCQNQSTQDKADDIPNCVKLGKMAFRIA